MNYEEAKKEFIKGIDSIARRHTPEQVFADFVSMAAMMTFIKETYPKQAKRLFCGTDDFKDFATAWAVCQFDMYQDILEDSGDEKYQRLLNLFKRKGL